MRRSIISGALNGEVKRCMHEEFNNSKKRIVSNSLVTFHNDRADRSTDSLCNQ